MRFKFKRTKRGALPNARPADLSSPEAVEKEKSPQKKRRKPSWPFILMVSLSLAAFIISMGFLIPQLLDYYNAAQESKKIQQGSVSDVAESGYHIINYENLLSTNKEFVAWMDVPGTNISYPVVYPTGSHANNDYYLHRNFNLNSSVEGALFVDYRSPKGFDNYNVVIYGHRLTSGTMFTQLDKFQKESFWQDYPEVHLYTPDGILIYKVFSSYMAPIDDDCYTFRFPGSGEFVKWAQKMADNSNYKTGIVPGPDDATILLSTCVPRSIADRTNFRYVTLAVLDHTEPNPVAA